ncbi:MAG TPA: hypothetical protein VK504_13800 [Vicinamibacterales bacterium]|nr:hypothetical protein [Vicinamibacterales bacterium]
MSPLIAVWVAAGASTVAGLAWALASHAWARVSEARWDRGLQ